MELYNSTKKKYNIKNLAIQGFCLVLLFLPVKVIESTAIYVTKTPSYIWYDYFSYAFSVVAIPIFLIAILFTIIYPLFDNKLIIPFKCSPSLHIFL